MVVILNDFVHMVRKSSDGTFGKKMAKREAHEGIFKLMLNDLRMAPTPKAFEGLTRKVLEVLCFCGEEEFAAYFEKQYLKPPWERWYLGATPAGVGSGGQQLIENSHKTDKAVLGPAALRAAPPVFIVNSLPKILQAAGEKLQKHPARQVSPFVVFLSRIA